MVYLIYLDVKSFSEPFYIQIRVKILENRRPLPWQNSCCLVSQRHTSAAHEKMLIYSSVPFYSAIATEVMVPTTSLPQTIPLPHQQIR
ncbi:hypothetical protein ACTXT7_005910 [Hymenolepis weldensis]